MTDILNRMSGPRTLTNRLIHEFAAAPPSLDWDGIIFVYCIKE